MFKAQPSDQKTFDVHHSNSRNRSLSLHRNRLDHKRTFCHMNQIRLPYNQFSLSSRSSRSKFHKSLAKMTRIQHMPDWRPRSTEMFRHKGTSPRKIDGRRLDTLTFAQYNFWSITERLEYSLLSSTYF